MFWQIEILLYLFLIAAAYAALHLRDLLAAAIAVTAFSFVVAALFVSMGAVDVGFTEATIGAGIVGVYYVATVIRTTRRTED